MREVYQAAFDYLQEGIVGPSLVEWAVANPSDFYKLSSKLLPIEMAVQGGITLQVITGVPRVPTIDGQAVEIKQIEVEDLL